MAKAQNPDLAEKFEDALIELVTSQEGCDLLRAHYDRDEEWPVVNVAESFNEAGVLTRDHGLIVNLSDGSVVEITVVAYAEEG